MISRIAKLLPSLVVWILDNAADAWRLLLGRPPVSRVVVLYYHAVPDRFRHRFARQMDELLRLAHPMSPDLGMGKVKPGVNVAITFDDGFRSVVHNALPELSQRKIPCAIFCPTGSWGARPSWIRKPTHPSWHESVLSQAELRSVAEDPLVTVGSHSISHPNFLRLSESDAKSELEQSRTELESVTDRPVRLFSFPHGAHNQRLVDLARAAGYQGVFTVEPRLAQTGQEFYLAGRFATEPTDWPIEFRLKSSGAYRWQSWIRGSPAKTL